MCSCVEISEEVRYVVDIDWRLAARSQFRHQANSGEEYGLTITFRSSLDYRVYAPRAVDRADRTCGC
jgi:hypothetical protein